MPSKSHWKELVALKRNQTRCKIPEQWLMCKSIVNCAKSTRKIVGGYMDNLLDIETTRITQMDSVDLVDAMKKGDLTATQVVTAFCERAAVAHQNENLMDILFAPALTRAQELDKYYRLHQKPIGPLHGLPFSVKDQFHVRDAETTMSYVGWIGTFEGQKGTGKEGVFESELISQLVNLGAIPIAKTSPTQTLWCAETNNNILEYNWNPHNQQLSSGGSSGGQAAFQALRGTTFGLGTDVGGSVTIPASFNAVYSIKPSHGRLSMRGVPDSSSGQAVAPTCAGMLGASLSCVRLGLQAVIEAQPWLHDPGLLPLPWNMDAIIDVEKKAHKADVCFGIMKHDGEVMPHPPVRRALEMVEQALRRQGFHVVEWSPPPHKEGVELHGAILNADGASDVDERLKLSGEPLIAELRSEFGGKRKKMGLPEFYHTATRLQEYRQRYKDYWMSSCGSHHAVDAFILPVAPHAAVIPGKWFHYGYSTIANVLDCPTISIPITVADSAVDVVDHDYQPQNDNDRKNWLAYDAAMYDGGPVGLQVVGQRLQEEKLLATAQIIVDALQAQHVSCIKPDDGACHRSCWQNSNRSPGLAPSDDVEDGTPCVSCNIS